MASRPKQQGNEQDRLLRGLGGVLGSERLELHRSLSSGLKSINKGKETVWYDTAGTTMDHQSQGGGRTSRSGVP